MSEPKPWPPEDQQAADALKVTSQIPARPTHAGEWEDVVVKAAKPDRGWPALAVAAIALLIAVGAGLGWQKHNAPELSPSREAQLVVDDENVTLSLGRLDVRTARKRVKVTTPHVELWVVGKVAADVDRNGTQVFVSEGEAEVRADRETFTLHAGESRKWPTPPPLPDSLRAPAPAAAGACDDRPVAERAACLVTASEGDGLTAQVALYQRASQQADGEALWRESLRRFPKGVMHPEVRLNLLRHLVDARQFDAAVREAAAFEQACPGDPRLPDVVRLRAALEARLHH